MTAVRKTGLMSSCDFNLNQYPGTVIDFDENCCLATEPSKHSLTAVFRAGRANRTRLTHHVLGMEWPALVQVMSPAHSNASSVNARGRAGRGGLSQPPGTPKVELGGQLSSELLAASQSGPSRARPCGADCSSVTGNCSSHQIRLVVNRLASQMTNSNQ